MRFRTEFSVLALVCTRPFLEPTTAIGAFPPLDAAANSSPVLQQTLQRAERDVILEALRAAHGSRREVAEKLGISPRTLRYKLARIRNAGIDVPAA